MEEEGEARTELRPLVAIPSAEPPAVQWYTKDDLVDMLVRRKRHDASSTVEAGLAILRKYRGRKVPGKKKGVPEDLEDMLVYIMTKVADQLTFRPPPPEAEPVKKTRRKRT